MDKMIKSADETGGEIPAVGYVRSATDGAEARASAAAQKARIETFAAECGIQIVDWHIDMGCSGNDLERAGLQAVLAAAQSPDPGFDAVVVYDLSRLARSFASLHAIEATLSKSGIRVMSVSEPEHGLTTEVFVRRVIETVAEFQRGAQARDMRRGLRTASERDCYVSAKVPYGYRRVEVYDNGRRHSKLEIDPESSEVVRTMYDRALGGSLPPAIAAELNDGYVASPSGGAWTSTQVQLILSNPVYAGVTAIVKRSGETVEMRDAHPKIVSWEVFAKVKDFLGRVASKAKALRR